MEDFWLRRGLISKSFQNNSLCIIYIWCKIQSYLVRIQFSKVSKKIFMLHANLLIIRVVITFCFVFFTKIMVVFYKFKNNFLHPLCWPKSIFGVNLGQNWFSGYQYRHTENSKTTFLSLGLSKRIFPQKLEIGDHERTWC